MVAGCGESRELDAMIGEGEVRNPALAIELRLDPPFGSADFRREVMGPDLAAIEDEDDTTGLFDVREIGL